MCDRTVGRNKREHFQKAGCHSMYQYQAIGSFRATMDGGLLEMDDALRAMLGHADTSWEDTPTLISILANAPAAEQLLETLQQRGGLLDHPIKLLHRNGSTIMCALNAFVNGTGAAPTIEGSLRDLTGTCRSALEHWHALDDQRALMAHVREGILVVQNGKVRYANNALGPLLGMADLTGKQVEEVLPEDLCTIIHESDMAPGSVLEYVLGEADQERHLLVHRDATVFMGEAAVQLTVSDPGAHKALLLERARATVAEEMNERLVTVIDEHRKTQEELQKSRQFARNLVDSSLDMIIAVDHSGNITEFNPAAGNRFGYEPQDVLGSSSSILYAEIEECDRVYEELHRFGVFTGEVRNKDAEGNIFVSFLAASRLYDGKGERIGSMGVSRDITRAREDRENLRSSEERYRDLFENATDLIHSVDGEGRILYVNSAWRNTMGYADEEILGRNILDIVEPDHAEAYSELLRRIIEEGVEVRIDTTYITKEGRTVCVQGHSNARRIDGRTVATRTILRDVTAERAANKAVREHQARQRALFESGEHMFWTVDRRIALTSFNLGYAKMVERLHGKRPEVNLDSAKPRSKFASDEYHTYWENNYAEAFTGKLVRMETDLLDRSGNRVCNEIFLSPIFDENGDVKEVFGIGHEITEQREAESKVREQGARLESIFGSTANLMVWTLDEDFRLSSFNPYSGTAFRENLGVELSVGTDMVSVIQNAVSAAQFERVMEHGRNVLKGSSQQMEVRIRDLEGQPTWLEIFLNPVRFDEKVVGVSCVAYGITDKKLAQQEVFESLHEKEVLLKEVHHRVKNNLQIISSIFNLKLSMSAEDPQVRSLLRESQDRIRSMAFIHESLYRSKNFSRIDLADYIDSLSRNLMMSYGLGGRVDLVRDLEPVQLGLDQAIPCGLILNELISNALKHAYPGDTAGEIRVKLRNVEERIELSVSDDGKGLDPDFDLTKHANLGLQLVQTLTEQLDGRLIRQAGTGASYLITFDRIK